MNIIISGPQGSGKGTQGRLLSERFGFYHMENGKILRAMSETDERIKQMLNEGALVPDEEMIQIMDEHLQSNNLGFDKIIFDGYPRNTSQYQALRDWLRENNTQIDFAVVLNISRETTIQRLSSRRVHRLTGETFNLITNPPIDVLEKDLIQREDDTPDAIEKRLDVYNKLTKPLIEEYRKDGILVEIDGEQEIERIYEEIVQKLDL